MEAYVVALLASTSSGECGLALAAETARDFSGDAELCESQAVATMSHMPAVNTNNLCPACMTVISTSPILDCQYRPRATNLQAFDRQVLDDLGSFLRSRLPLQLLPHVWHEADRIAAVNLPQGFVRQPHAIDVP
jgi:hypothetical protein